MTNLSVDSKRDSVENSDRILPSVYRAGIVGLGFIGLEAPDNHAQAYVDCERTDLVAMCDKSPMVIRDYQHHMKMVKTENLDIVSVCTPVETHCQIVCDIAKYVKGIYCEKPMATSLKECDRMIEACEKHNTILQINHQRRFVDPVFRFSRGLINTGTHVFDLLRSMLGECHGVGQYALFDRRSVKIEYVDSEEHIFEFDCTRSDERMILAGVRWIVSVLDYGLELSTGYDGKQALRLALEFKEWYENGRT